MVGAGADKTTPPVPGGPAVVLVRPQLAVNIGMCARAMANFGLADLRLVNPREGWPRSDEYRDVAYSAAAGATGVLDAARVFLSVDAAVADLNAVYATTARERGQMKPVLTPSAAMAATAAAAGRRERP
jgi:tRNA/rRNA methyltransferase